MSRVLVVEDERKLLRNLHRGLVAEGHEVITASTGEDALRCLSDGLFHCLILDWMLPGRDGIQVLNALRGAGKRIPVVMLTARDSVEDRVVGLDHGADDYLV